MKRPNLNIIGLSIGAAAQVIEAAGYTFRVVMRDGQPCIGTRDMRSDRLNLTMTNRVITHYEVG